MTADESAADTATVKFWDPNTLVLLGQWQYPHGGVFPLAVSPDGRLATAGLPKGGKEFRVDVWDVASGRHLAEIEGRHAEPVQGLVFSPDGRLVASAAPDGTVRVADSHTGRLVHLFQHDPRGGFHFWCTAFSPDGRWLAAGYGNERQTSGGVLLWDVATGEATGSLPGQQVMGLAFGPGGDCSLAVSTARSASGTRNAGRRSSHSAGTPT